MNAILAQQLYKNVYITHSESFKNCVSIILFVLIFKDQLSLKKPRFNIYLKLGKWLMPVLLAPHSLLHMNFLKLYKMSTHSFITQLSISSNE